MQPVFLQSNKDKVISSSSELSRLTFIKSSPLALGLTDHECSELASRARFRVYNRHDQLFMQGENQRELFLVRTGQIKLNQVSQGGSEVLLWICGTNSVLGIQSELKSRPYSCSAYAVEPSSAWSWDHQAISQLISDFPQLSRNLGAILMNRLGELEERFRELATENVSCRLALALVRLSNNVGKKGPKGSEIYLSRAELAQMTGTTLFTVSRILSRWAEEAVIVLGRRSVVLADLGRIQSRTYE
jgi:CRP-like cAMP-binding protein